MGSMCSHILSHHASPIFDLGHFLFYKAWQSWPAWVIILLYPVGSTFHQHVPCLAMPNRTRACSCSWKLCAAEQPCLESNWCNCSDFKRQVYWVDCFVMFCWGCTSVYLFLMFLAWNPKIPINLPVHQDYYAKFHEGIALTLQIATGRPKSQFPSRRLQPREREHQYDSIEIYWNIQYVYSSRPFKSSTYTLSCRNKSWIANVPYDIYLTLSYILKSIQGSSNIMNIQQFNIRNLDINFRIHHSSARSQSRSTPKLAAPGELQFINFRMK